MANRNLNVGVPSGTNVYRPYSALQRLGFVVGGCVAVFVALAAFSSGKIDSFVIGAVMAVIGLSGAGGVMLGLLGGTEKL